MRYFSHYLPFFIITTALYAAVFYHHKEVTVITPLPLNSGQQSVQVQFINERQAPSGKSASELKKEKIKPAANVAAKKEQIKATDEIQKKQNNQHTAMLAAHSKNSAEITAATHKLQKSIRETTAKHDAQLKAELFSEQLQQDAGVTENSPKLPQNKKPKLAAMPKKMKKPAPVVDDEREQPHKKNKRIFKKKPAAAVSAVKNSGVLQEALVVSGNIPTYPKRAILRNQQGRVVVQLTVDISGTAHNPKIITSSGHTILDTAVLDFIARERFMPAHRGTEKVSSQQIFVFRFELK